MGVQTEDRALGPEDEWGKLPEEIRLDIEEGTAYLAEFGFDGGDPAVVHPKDVREPPRNRDKINADKCSSRARQF